MTKCSMYTDAAITMANRVVQRYDASKEPDLYAHVWQRLRDQPCQNTEDAAVLFAILVVIDEKNTTVQENLSSLRN